MYYYDILKFATMLIRMYVLTIFNTKYITGWLHSWRQPIEDVVYGRLRVEISAKDPPPQLVPAICGGSPGQDTMLSWVCCAELEWA